MKIWKKSISQKKKIFLIHSAEKETLRINSKAWNKYGMGEMEWVELVKKAVGMALEPVQQEF